MKDKTKELADSVGAVYPVLLMGRSDGVLFTEFELETFVERIRAEERESCAKWLDFYDGPNGRRAEAIRERGNE